MWVPGNTLLFAWLVIENVPVSTLEKHSTNQEGFGKTSDPAPVPDCIIDPKAQVSPSEIHVMLVPDHVSQVVQSQGLSLDAISGQTLSGSMWPECWCLIGQPISLGYMHPKLLPLLSPCPGVRLPSWPNDSLTFFLSVPTPFPVTGISPNEIIVQVIPSLFLLLRRLEDKHSSSLFNLSALMKC